MDHSNIGDRMKRYESVSKIQLMNRTPVIIRIDGKAFHTFTKHFEKPFDEIMMGSMQDTMQYLCENIQGCVLGYTQSDEISLLLINYQNLESTSWFDNEVQKLCSVSASMATCAFNMAFLRRWTQWAHKHPEIYYKDLKPEAERKEVLRLHAAYLEKINKAVFDSRCFNIPKEEVTNYFLWRQLDAARNSINSMGFAYLGFRKMQKKSSNEVKDMLLKEKGMDWDAMDAKYKWGSCCIRNIKGEGGWVVDNNIAKFIGEGREYIDRLVLL